MDSTILKEISKRPLIPVIVIEDADDAVPLAEALLEGGMDIVEVTFRTDAAADAVQRIAKAVAWRRNNFNQRTGSTGA
jgi:2-dehydro-3-deoxyphosphogluconate aldolase/(4S)-4-hydroxy-2-oxoglutarate aldolase